VLASGGPTTWGAAVARPCHLPHPALLADVRWLHWHLAPALLCNWPQEPCGDVSKQSLPFSARGSHHGDRDDNGSIQGHLRSLLLSKTNRKACIVRFHDEQSQEGADCNPTVQVAVSWPMRLKASSLTKMPLAMVAGQSVNTWARRSSSELQARSDCGAHKPQLMARQS